jgi:predicted Zn-dependent protease
MKTELEFQKALLLLDRGELERGRQKLKDVIYQANDNNDTVTLIQSLVCFGELLLEQGSPEEATGILNRALSLKNGNEALEYEFNRAIDLLSKISKKPS